MIRTRGHTHVFLLLVERIASLTTEEFSLALCKTVTWMTRATRVSFSLGRFSKDSKGHGNPRGLTSSDCFSELKEAAKLFQGRQPGKSANANYIMKRKQRWHNDGTKNCVRERKCDNTTANTLPFGYQTRISIDDKMHVALIENGKLNASTSHIRGKGQEIIFSDRTN